MQLVFLAKDTLAERTITSFPDGVDVVEEGDVAAFVEPVAAAVTEDLPIHAFNEVDWADAAEPAAAEIMINVATRQWKAGRALVDGDILWAVVVPTGTRVLVS